eukprot:13022-Prorocentrum_lima.AAC.1
MDKQRSEKLTRPRFCVDSLKVVGSQVLGKDDAAAAMGFGDAALVLQTCEKRLTEWIALLKDAGKHGLEKQIACQLLTWVGSSLAVHAVRTTLQSAI